MSCMHTPVCEDSSTRVCEYTVVLHACVRMCGWMHLFVMLASACICAYVFRDGRIYMGCMRMRVCAYAWMLDACKHASMQACKHAHLRERASKHANCPSVFAGMRAYLCPYTCNAWVGVQACERARCMESCASMQAHCPYMRACVHVSWCAYTCNACTCAYDANKLTQMRSYEHAQMRAYVRRRIRMRHVCLCGGLAMHARTQAAYVPTLRSRSGTRWRAR